MVYDCILFNDELHLLELRLAYLYNSVDKFVIGESLSTFSNQNKPLYYKDNAERFARYHDKIIHLEIPSITGQGSWEVEFHQRDYLKTALGGCSDDDLIIIADVDEFPDMDQLRKTGQLTNPCMIHTPLYYYFFNLKTEIYWCRMLITPFSYIKDFDIGDRLKYSDLQPVILKSGEVALGWHFSYLFGWNIALYQSKLKAFAHQELNTAHFLDKRRIETCLHLGIDFLERYSIYEAVDMESEFPAGLREAINQVLPVDEYLYRKPPLSFYLNPYHLKYYLKFIVKLRLRGKLTQLQKSRHSIE